MSFILSAQRDADNYSSKAWKNYQRYLKSHLDLLPPGVFKLATSEWWYSFSRADAPHDSRLKKAKIKDKPLPSIEIELDSACQGLIHLKYSKVFNYSLHFNADRSGIHGDWQYDEFSVTKHRGRFIHTLNGPMADYGKSRLLTSFTSTENRRNIWVDCSAVKRRCSAVRVTRLLCGAVDPVEGLG